MKLTPVFKRLHSVDAKGFDAGNVHWINWNHVVHLVRVRETREFPEHTRITLSLRPDLDLILRVAETPEQLTEVYT